MSLFCFCREFFNNNAFFCFYIAHKILPVENHTQKEGKGSYKQENGNDDPEPGPIQGNQDQGAKPSNVRRALHEAMPEVGPFCGFFPPT